MQKQNLAILNFRRNDKAVIKAGCNRRDEQNGNEDRGRQRLYTHEVREHRWKQSGIREDVRPVTQEEGQVT